MDDTILFPEIAAYNSIAIPMAMVSRSRRRRIVKKAKKRLRKVGADGGAQPSATLPSEILLTELSAIRLKGEVGAPPPEPLAPLLSDPLCESSKIERTSDFVPPPSKGFSFAMASSDSGVVVLNAPMTASDVTMPEKKRKRSALPFSESIGYNLRSRS